MSRRITKDEVLARFVEVHGSTYDYSRVTYLNSKSKVEIICSQHGAFLQSPEAHWGQRQGCPVCAGNQTSKLDAFVLKCREIHGDLYNYSQVVYKNNSSKILIECRVHGCFSQRPLDHLNGNGCPKCRCSEVDTPTFVARAISVHGDRYDYSRTHYVRSASKLTIGCKTHGDFKMLPGNHITSKQGCPKCRASKGERAIMTWLQTKGFQFQTQAKFSDCVNPKTGRELPFDFYIPSLNLLIEFDGLQHSQAVERFGGLDGLVQVQARDAIKTDFCDQTGKHLLRIESAKKVQSTLETELGLLLC